jgi:hypothetical protein
VSGLTAGTAGLDTPDNRKFVAAINAEFQHDPGFYTAGPYTALLIIEQALNANGGRTADGAEFLKAMHDVRLNRGPIGPVHLDDYGNADPRHPYPSRRARERKTRQYYPKDISAGEPILDLRPYQVRDPTGFLARLPAEQISRMRYAPRWASG